MSAAATTRDAVPVITLSGDASSSVKVTQEFFTAPIKTALLAQAIQVNRANQRKGTASTKTRAFVSGGGKKPWKQKGTGRARHGSSRSPLWRHGGVVFGPHPRSFRQDLSVRNKRQALYEALRAKVRDDELVIVDGLVAEKPSTKQFAKSKAFSKEQGRILVLISSLSGPLYRSLRNIPHVRVVAANGVTPFELINANRVLVAKDEWDGLVGRCKIAVKHRKESTNG